MRIGKTKADLAREDLQMMRRPERWPAWPALPMKRYRESGAMETGLLVDDGGEYLWIPGANLYERVTTKDSRIVRDPDLQKIVDDGWQVD